LTLYPLRSTFFSTAHGNWPIPNWQKPLSAADRKHLKETCDGRPTLEKFKLNRRLQIKEGITCFECKSIARKLGLE
jgi:hypothetical protein